jgi:hypothetical protein
VPDTAVASGDVANVGQLLQTGDSTGGKGSTGGGRDPLQGGTVSCQTVKLSNCQNVSPSILNPLTPIYKDVAQ